MMRRILDALRRRPAEQPPRQMRPNELRREVVQAERRRREARAAEVALPRMDEEERRPREPVVTPPVAPSSDQASLPGVLKTRAGLRQAWLVKEILDSPVGIRGPHRDG